MKMIRPTSISDAMLVFCSVAEADTGETPWSATEINAVGDRRYLGSPSSVVTISNASPGVITWAANGLAVDTPVVFSTTSGLPTGLTAGTTYFVKTILTTSTFTVCAVVGGAAIATSSAGAGVHTATAKVHTIYEAAIGSRATVTISNAAPGVVTDVAHGMIADTPIVFTTTSGLPNPLVAGTTYYVKTPLTDSYNVAATAGGAAINTTTAGAGVHTRGLASNYNKPPMINTTAWLEVSPTNRWAQFDNANNTVTQEDGTLITRISPGRFNSLALIGVDAATVDVALLINQGTATMTIANPCVVTKAAHGYAADTPIRFYSTGALPTGITRDVTYYVKSPLANTFNVAATPGGAAIVTTGVQSGVHTVGQVAYAYNANLGTGVVVGNWYQYFYEPIYQRDAVSVTDIVDSTLLALPAYQNGVLSIIIERVGGQVQVGATIVGMAYDLGETLTKPQIGIIDYSRKTTNDFGVTTFVKRNYSKRMTAQVLVESADVDNLVSVLAAYRATPVVFVGSDALYTSMIIHGAYKDWEIVPEQEDVPAILNLQVEGLT